MDKFDKELDQMDEFDFKPITEGLGFHHSIAEKSKIKAKLKSQQKSLQTDLDHRAQLLKTAAPDSKPHVEHMGELAAFYNNEEFNPANVAPLVKSEAVAHLNPEVSMGVRFVAWIVDLAVVTFMFITAIISILFASDMPLDLINPVMISNDLSVSFVAIFLMFYTFYFTFLDKTEYSTLGKRLFNIKLSGMLRGPTLFNTLNRTILSLCSVFTLGLLSMLSLQDSLTDTKVVKRENV
jgi:uncharacterized RDD family membrane protein YckC